MLTPRGQSFKTSRALTTLAATVLLQGGSGCAYFARRDAVHRINKVIQESQGVFQEKRALLVGERALAADFRVDLVAHVSRQRVEDLQTMLKDALNRSDKLAKEGVRVEKLAIHLAPQEIAADLAVSKVIDGETVRANAYVAGFVTAIDNGLYINLVARQLHVDCAALGAPSLSSAEEAAYRIADALRLVVPVLNVVLDEELNTNKERALLVRYDLNPLWTKSTQDQLANDSGVLLQTADQELGIRVKRALPRVDRNGIALLAEIEAGPPAAAPAPAVPTVGRDDIVDVPSNAVRARVVAYLARVDEFASRSLAAGDAKRLSSSETFVFVTRRAVARVLSATTAAGSITVATRFSYADSHTESLTIPFPDPGPDCRKLLDYCPIKDMCANPNACRITRQVPGLDPACVAGCCGGAVWLGCAVSQVRHACRDGCGTVQNVVDDVVSVPCNLFRSTLARVPGVCDVSRWTTAATCMPQNVRVVDPVCNSLSAVAAYFRTRPFANVTAAVDIRDMPVSGAVTFNQVSDDLATVGATASAAASGPLKFSLAYERRVPTDSAFPARIHPALTLGVCTLNWSRDYSVDASASTTRDVKFTVTPEQAEGKELILRFDDERPWNAFVNFSPSPLSRLMMASPQLVLSCPLAVFAGAGLAVQDLVKNKQETRTLWPLLTGEHFPLHLNAIHLEVKLPALRTKLNESGDDLRLKPQLLAGGILYKE